MDCIWALWRRHAARTNALLLSPKEAGRCVAPAPVLVPHSGIASRRVTAVDFDTTLHTLASWAGRYVAVNVRPAMSDWYIVQMGGPLPKRTSDAIEGADDLADGTYSFRFSDAGWVTCFWMRRTEFVTASLNDRMLSIETKGATIDVYAPAK